MNHLLSYRIHDSVLTLRILFYYFCFVFSVDIYFEISDDANILEDRGAHSPVVRILWPFPPGFICPTCKEIGQLCLRDFLFPFLRGLLHVLLLLCVPHLYKLLTGVSC
jgi:hypothetical protein